MLAPQWRKDGGQSTHSLSLSLSSVTQSLCQHGACAKVISIIMSLCLLSCPLHPKPGHLLQSSHSGEWTWTEMGHFFFLREGVGGGSADCTIKNVNCCSGSSHILTEDSQKVVMGRRSHDDAMKPSIDWS